MTGQMPGQLPEQCRAEQNTGQYLTDNAWLPAALGYHAKHRGHNQYQGNLADDIRNNYIHGKLASEEGFE